MRNLNLDGYRPYGNMAKTCETRKIKEKKIIWPDREKVIDDRFVIRAMGRKDVDEVTELWRASYPEVYGSIHEWMLFPDEYEQKMAFKETWDHDAVHRQFATIVCDDLKNQKLVFANLLTKFDVNLHVEASFFAIHPDFRKGNLDLNIWAELHEFYLWLEESGAEYVTVFCETWQNITQYIWFKQMGWKIAGIFPGSYTRWCGGQNEYRACTVHFYRLLNGGERYSTKPEEWQMLPEVKKLWDCLEEINKASDPGALKEATR